MMKHFFITINPNDPATLVVVGEACIELESHKRGYLYVGWPIVEHSYILVEGLKLRVKMGLVYNAELFTWIIDEKDLTFISVLERKQYMPPPAVMEKVLYYMNHALLGWWQVLGENYKKDLRLSLCRDAMENGDNRIKEIKKELEQAEDKQMSLVLDYLAMRPTSIKEK